MRISRHFHLNRDQVELDFVDIDTSRDLPLFVDPYFLSLRSDPWSMRATQTVASFFNYFMGLIANGDEDEARNLFDHLHEPNETCLGLSRRRPRGNGIGEGDATRIFDSLIESQAARTGLLEHLEDCRLFVHGIDKDKTSDMTTNIIRSHLIEYTQRQCELWGLPLTDDSPSGFFWNGAIRAWESGFTRNLHVGHRRILLVPKSIVSFKLRYTPQRFHRHFVLNFLQHEHLRMNSALVRSRRRRDGSERRWVTKKDLVEKGGAAFDKDFLATFTRAHPQVFAAFKATRQTGEESIPIELLTHQRIAEICEYLERRLADTAPGPDQATAYHRTVVGILDFLFYPRLTTPRVEERIHEGRQRIDVTFDNGAQDGFFARIPEQAHIPCPFVMVECKNYRSRDINNPEIHQMGGRFSPNRGQVGLVVCRSVEDEETLLARCRDTLRDQRGLILPLTDADLINGLRQRAHDEPNPLEQRLSELYRAIAMQ